MLRQRLYRLTMGTMLFVSLLWGGLSQAAVAAAAGTATGTVDSAIGLNLRAGPGLGHRVLLVLPDGQALELMGRSQNSQWLEARLPDSGMGGWVFAAYVNTGAEVGELPVSEAAGGPTDGRPPAAQAYSLYVTIADNQAVVYLQKFPANSEVAISLGRAGAAADLLVAHGQTDANGQAQIAFAMPARWADGQRLTERNLVLAAAAAEGQFGQSVNLLYVR